MFNQLRSERDNFRKFVIRFHKVIIDKDDIINVLHEIELIIE